MKFSHVNGLCLCLAVLVSSLAEGASPQADTSQPATSATGQKQSPPVEESLDGFPILLAGEKRDQCSTGCESQRKSCADRCPGYDEDKVVDPNYASRKCKAACDEALSQCKGACPND